MASMEVKPGIVLLVVVLLLILGNFELTMPATTNFSLMTKETKTSSLGSCTKENHTLVNNNVLPKNITHQGRRIPRVIHFFAKSKCLPTQIASNLYRWKLLPEHSVIFHDQEEMQTYLSKRRDDLPYVRKALFCASSHESLLDLFRLVFLYDHGGISVDIDHIPGPGLSNGTILDNGKDIYKTYQFVVEDGEASPYPRFLASEVKHYALLPLLIHSIARQFTDHIYNGTSNFGGYSQRRNSIYKEALSEFKGLGDDLMINVKTKESDREIGIINTNQTVVRTGGGILIKLPLSSELKESVKFDMAGKKCVELSEESYKVDVDSLLEVTGTKSDANETCLGDLVYMGNTYLPESISKERKIPKIIHMTSKTKCFTEKLARNARQWQSEEYSFFMHDNVAVERLLSKEWPEFPLIHEFIPCLSSGAGLADYWRYLALWEFGGIYTDMDNAPGAKFANGSIITDTYDSFFEVEGGGFPSQYFYAVSPHHPISYFMVHIAIERLLSLVNNVQKQYVPYTTGPGTVKSAMIAQIGGNGYPKVGHYHGVYNRSVTMIQRDLACARSKAKPSVEEMESMNMVYYQKKEGKHGSTGSCLSQVLINHTETSPVQ